MFLSTIKRMGQRRMRPHMGSRLLASAVTADAVLEGNNGSSPSREQKEASRKRIQWKHRDYLDEAKLEQESRRVFDVCHGCRACFDLCDSFPTLFKMVDESKTQELDSVPSSSFKKVVDACTLCDMCYMPTCPYTPPHPLNIDFPHLMLRHRAVENRQKNDLSPAAQQDNEEEFEWPHRDENVEVLSDTDRKLSLRPPSGIHEKARLPKYSTEFVATEASVSGARVESVTSNHKREKVVLFPGCLCNYQNTSIAAMSKRVLEEIVECDVQVVYDECCGMPQLESGDLKTVNGKAIRTASRMRKYVDDGYVVVTPVASCALMMKKEWPLIASDDENVAKLAKSTLDVCEYVLARIKNDSSLADKLQPLHCNISLHQACHQRAQNVGFKSRDLLKLIPKSKLMPVVKCSGHGGSWGAMKENFDTAVKVGRPAVQMVSRALKQTQKQHKEVHYISSDCPLAADHIEQCLRMETNGDEIEIVKNMHPIEIVAVSCGLHPSVAL